MAAGRQSLRRLSVDSFPRLTGKYGVGAVDVFHSSEHDKQSLLFRLYYPTTERPEGASKSQLMKWIPSYKYIKPLLYDTGFMSSFSASIVSPLISLFFDPHVPAICSAPLLSSSEGKERMPIVVFSHGLTAMRTTYSAIHCDLASHGYIVAALEHRDHSASLCGTQNKVTDSNGQVSFQEAWIEYIDRPKIELPLRHDQVKQRSSEMGQVLDFLHQLDLGKETAIFPNGKLDVSQFQGRLDFDHVVAMGHSFGAASSIVSITEDDRFHCAVALDSWMFPIYKEVYTKVSKPLLFINSWSFHWPYNIRRILKLTKHLGPLCKLVTLRGTSHTSQTDTPFIVPAFVLKQINYPSAIDPIVAYEVNQELSHAFLKRYLWKDVSPCELLDREDDHHEVIMNGTNVDPSLEMDQEEEELIKEFGKGDHAVPHSDPLPDEQAKL